MRARTSAACIGAIALSLAACSSLLGLNELDKVDCLKNCGGTSSGASSAAGGDFAVFAGNGGSSPGDSGSSGSAGSTSGGTSANGGTSTSGGNAALGGGGTHASGGSGGGGAAKTCPGGDVPPTTWQEHWYEHNQLLNRVYYDDCVAIYFDSDMDSTAVNWIAPFMTSVWTYSLKTYGTMGPGRLFAVFHMGRYSGGHSGNYYESLHDFRNATDGGQDSWPDKSYDLPASLPGFVVESTASHTKYGSPAGTLWGNNFADLYKFDLYTGLGMTAEAKAEQTLLNGTTTDSPNTSTYWFRDWFYPIWNTYGHAAPFARFFGLLQQYYPADANGNMADMNWGEYVHFMSGAAGKNLQPLAQTAFGWPADWETQFQKAQGDYPEITY